jgi:hypothetical protein
MRSWLRSSLWQAFWIANATYPGSTAFIKLALLFQYLRIYDKGSKFYIATLSTIVCTSLWGLAYSIIGWVPTVPVAGFWKMEMPATRYGYGSLNVENFVGTYESHAALNMLLDAVVLAIAVPMFSKQGASKNSYRGLLGLFVLGGMCVSPDSSYHCVANLFPASTYFLSGGYRVSWRRVLPRRLLLIQLGTGPHQ